MSSSLEPAMTRAAAVRASSNADQIEVDAIREGTTSVVECLVDDAIAYDRLTEEYETATNPRGNAEWAEEDDARETAVGNTISEIGRRRKYSGEHYPFDLSADSHLLTYIGERARSRVYEFCLALSTTRQLLTAAPACDAVREFERLVGRLLKSLLHPSAAPGDGCAHWYRSGAPPAGDRPTTMSSMLADLNKKTCEWRFSPPQGREAQAEQGDDGVDVVVWKWFGEHDRRIGKPFLLAQCACGDDNHWYDKRHELDPTDFESKWGGTISYGGLLKCLATPRHIPHPAVWLEGTTGGGILLDRIRLNWIAENCLAAPEHAALGELLLPHVEMLRRAPARRGRRTGK